MIKIETTCVRDCADLEMINRNISAIHLKSEFFNKTALTYGLLGNETRLKIIWIIKNENAICVCDLSDILGISISAISQQLKKLKTGGLLTNRKERQTIFYSIHPDFNDIISTVLSENLEVITA